jgi:hypothetical protein
MKMNSGKRSGSRWALGGLAVLLGAGGVLTFGTPGGEQAGCGGGYFDEDTGKLVVDDVGAGERAQRLSFSPGGVAPGSPGWSPAGDECTLTPYDRIYSQNHQDWLAAYEASQPVPVVITADSVCETPPTALACGEVNTSDNRLLSFAHCEDHFDNLDLQDTLDAASPNIDFVHLQFTKRARTLLRFSAQVVMAKCLRSLGGVVFGGWGAAVDVAATIALWANERAEVAELKRTIERAVELNKKMLKKSQTRCQISIGKLLKSMEEDDDRVCLRPSELPPVRGVCSRSNNCCDCSDCDPCDAERSPLEVVRRLISVSQEALHIFIQEHDRWRNWERCQRGMVSTHRSYSNARNIKATEEALAHLRPLRDKLEEWDSKNSRTNGPDSDCVVSCEASDSEQVSGQ